MIKIPQPSLIFGTLIMGLATFGCSNIIDLKEPQPVPPVSTETFVQNKAQSAPNVSGTKETLTQRKRKPLPDLKKDGVASSDGDGRAGVPETQPICEMSAISVGPLSIEGTSESDPNRVYINEQFRFEPGRTIDENGRKKTSVFIFEIMEMGFYADWISESISTISSQVAAGLSSSCSNVVGPLNSRLVSYLPPTGQFQISATKRACAVVELPCGAPEITCHGGRLCCPPEVPVCTTRVPMCRHEASQDVFSTTAKIEFQANVSFTGKAPNQVIAITRNITKDDVSTSSGDLFKLYSDMNVLNVLVSKLADAERQMQHTINDEAKVLGNGSAAFKIPTSDFIYLPEVTEVKWGNPANKPTGAAPFSIIVQRKAELDTPLACKFISCIKQSKAAGKLLVNSCSI
jgi:hypothetical protein